MLVKLVGRTYRIMTDRDVFTVDVTEDEVIITDAGGNAIRMLIEEFEAMAGLVSEKSTVQ